MSYRLAIPIITAIALAATAAHAGCTKPKTDVVIPDGSKATLKQMLSAHSKFEAYDQAVTTYVKCLNTQESEELKAGGKRMSKAQMKQIDQRYQRKRDAILNHEQALANQLNAQIKTFKAKHAKSSK